MNPLQVDKEAAMRMIKAGIRQDPISKWTILTLYIFILEYIEVNFHVVIIFLLHLQKFFYFDVWRG